MTSSPERPRKRLSLSDAVRAAAAAAPGAGTACPSIEEIHGAVAGTATAEVRERVRAHAATCGACGAEVALAKAFERPESAAEAAEVDRVLGSMRRPVPVLRGGPSRGRRFLAFAAAAAAVLLLAITVGPRLWNDRPEIHDPSNVTRGEDIRLESPLAATAAGLVTFRWTDVSDARSYEVVVKAADGSEVLRRSAPQNRLEVRSDAADTGFRPGSIYFWSVRAVGNEGADLGSSQTGTFHIVP